MDVEHHTELTTDHARQGETGHHLRYILGWGICLAVMAMVVMVMLAT